MSNLLIIFERNSPSSISIVHAMGDFKKEYCGGLRAKRSKNVKSSDLSWCDILMIVRGDSPLESAIACRAKKAGRFVISMWDDDMLDPYPGFVQLPKRKRNLLRVLTYTDVLLTPNAALGMKLAPYIPSQRYAVMNTPVSADMLAPYNESEGPIKIVYAASADHAAQFEICISPILPELFSMFGRGISFTFIGVHPNIPPLASGLKEQIQYLDIMPMQTYRAHMAEMKYDIGVAPLVKNSFSQYKYFNKFIEYSISGSFGIYSNCLPYVLIVKSGKNGLLCENTPADWKVALTYAIKDAALRKHCIENAQKQLREEFCTQRIFQILLEDIPELATHVAPNTHIGSMLFDKGIYSVFMMIYSPVAFIFAEGLFNMLRRGMNHYKYTKQYGGLK